MKTAPSTKQSNPSVKQAVIAFQRPQARQLEHGQYHTYKLRTTPAPPQQMLHCLSTSSLYLSLMMELQKSGSSSSADYRWCSRDKTLRRDPQAAQLLRPFSRAIR
eukprot:5794020-Ditylum_brightwellii.AAC.1